MTIKDVQKFHAKFGLPLGLRNQLKDKSTQDFRIKFLQEELDEFTIAIKDGDRVKAFDALLDLSYVTYGTALFMGVNPQQWDAGFTAVQKANMAKERAVDSADSRSKRKNSFDVVKPEGWVGPESELLRVMTTMSGSPDVELEEVKIEEGAHDQDAMVATLLDTEVMLLEIQDRGGHPGALAEAALLCIRKSSDYNGVNPDPHKVDRSNYFPFGIMSYGHMIHTKSQRFISLCEARISGRPVNFEGLRDTALDLINYAGFFVSSTESSEEGDAK